MTAVAIAPAFRERVLAAEVTETIRREIDALDLCGVYLVMREDGFVWLGRGSHPSNRTVVMAAGTPPLQVRLTFSRLVLLLEEFRQFLVEEFEYQYEIALSLKNPTMMERVENCMAQSRAMIGPPQPGCLFGLPVVAVETTKPEPDISEALGA